MFQEQYIEYFSGILREINTIIFMVHFFCFYRDCYFMVECVTISFKKKPTVIFFLSVSFHSLSLQIPPKMQTCAIELPIMSSSYTRSSCCCRWLHRMKSSRKDFSWVFVLKLNWLLVIKKCEYLLPILLFSTVLWIHISHALNDTSKCIMRKIALEVFVVETSSSNYQNIVLGKQIQKTFNCSVRQGCGIWKQDGKCEISKVFPIQCIISYYIAS